MAEESWRLPNSVQHLAANVQEPPSRYLLREQEPYGGNLAGTKIPEAIPTIDLGLLSASSDTQEANKLRSTLQSWGFFQVIEHLNLVLQFPAPKLLLVSLHFCFVFMESLISFVTFMILCYY